MAKWYEKIKDAYSNQASHYLSAVSLGDMTTKEEKLYRQPENILSRPIDHPIWKDENFWKNKWPKIVDDAGEVVDTASKRMTDKLKWLNEICDYMEGRLVSYEI